MTPVVTLQRRFRELGRIRMGAVVPTSSGKTRPSALKQWRLTAYGTVGERLLTQAAALYGGEPRPWQNAPQGGGWELFTTSESLAFIVPPVPKPFEVWLEKWTAAGCERRCDGERAQVYGGRARGWRDGPCKCESSTDPLKRECSIVFRFSVILPEIEGLGTWHVQTHSFHGAEELQGALSVLGARAAEGIVTPAHLRIEPREIKRPAVAPDGSTKTEVSKFVVPVIDFEETIGALLSGGGERIALPGSGRAASGRPALPAGTPALPSAPIRVDTVEEPPPGPGWGSPPPTEDDSPLEGEIEPEEATISTEDRRDAVKLWTETLGFTPEEVQAVMHDVAGVSATADLTDTARWAVEGELRRIAAERAQDGAE